MTLATGKRMSRDEVDRELAKAGASAAGGIVLGAVAFTIAQAPALSGNFPMWAVGAFAGTAFVNSIWKFLKVASSRVEGDSDAPVLPAWSFLLFVLGHYGIGAVACTIAYTIYMEPSMSEGMWWVPEGLGIVVWMLGGLAGGVVLSMEIKQTAESHGNNWFAAGSVAVSASIIEVVGYYLLMWQIAIHIIAAAR